MRFPRKFFIDAKKKRSASSKLSGEQASEHLPSSATIIIRTADAPRRTTASLRILQDLFVTHWCKTNSYEIEKNVSFHHLTAMIFLFVITVSIMNVIHTFVSLEDIFNTCATCNKVPQ